MITVQALADELGQTVDAVATFLQQIPGFPQPPKPTRGISDVNANEVRKSFGAPTVPDRTRMQGRPERWSDADITELINDEVGRW